MTKKSYSRLAALLLLLVMSASLVYEYGTTSKLVIEFTYAPESIKAVKKYKIGYFVHRGSIGEHEAMKRRCIAGQNLGWDCYIFHYDVNLGTSWMDAKLLYMLTNVINWFFKPDFIVHSSASYYPVTSYDIPNYLIISYELNKDWLKSGEIWGNVGSYDGYILYTPADNWFKALNPKSVTNSGIVSDRKLFITLANSTVPLTKYQPVSYNKIFYCGDNWDTLRASKHYHQIFLGLEEMDKIEVFGLRQSWKFLNKSYKGYLPHDGVSLMNKIKELGIVLILHSQRHLDSGTPTNRIFEASAAGALIISDLHPFVQKKFGDCVLYIDPKQDVDVVVNHIKQHVQWAADNKDLAAQKAKCAYDIFAKQFALEDDLLNIINMHEEVKANYF